MSETVLHQILNRAGFSPVTKEKYRAIIDRWIAYAGPNPASWTRDAAQDWYDSLLEGGLMVQSANQYLSSLRYVSRWYATKSGGIDFAIVQTQRGKKGQKRESSEAPVLGEDEIAALLTHTAIGEPADFRDFALIVVALETGMRRMSLRGMGLAGFKQRAGYTVATVPIKGAGGEETFDVPLSDVAMSALGAWLDWLRDKPRRVKDGPVFRHVSKNQLDDDPLSLTAINDIVAARASAAGIRHVNPHMFRHTFITSRTTAGFNPMEIAAITGHKPSAIVVDGTRIKLGAMSTYMHGDVEKIRNSTPAWLADLVYSITRRRS